MVFHDLKVLLGNALYRCTRPCFNGLYVSFGILVMKQGVNGLRVTHARYTTKYATAGYTWLLVPFSSAPCLVLFAFVDVAMKLEKKLEHQIVCLMLSSRLNLLLAIRFLASCMCVSFTRHVALQARVFKSSLIYITGKHEKFILHLTCNCFRK